jgi:ABC-type lipoprotein release transport system permease subunit
VIWTIAWRNVWRNGRRSGILIGAIVFGIWAGLLEMALMNGMARQQVEAAIETRTSHLQIHAAGFRGHPDVNLFIPDGDSLLARVRQMPEVTVAAGRAVLGGMVSSATTARGIAVYGIDPEAEQRLTDVAEQIVAGTYFASGKRNPAVIGEKLAEKLGVELGQKIVVTGQAADSSISAGAFRIVGIFKTVNSVFDESTIFVERADLARTFGLGHNLYEIAIRVRDPGAIEPAAATLRRAHPGLDVATWRDLSPEVALTRDSTQQMNDIFLIVILIALVFGITNTMLMGVMERTRELGVVIALGMRPGPVFTMVLLETIFIAVVGGLGGIGLGAATIGVLGRSGIDLSFVSSGLAAFGMDTVVYPLMPAAEYPWVVFLVIVTAIVASLYPGWRAIRLDPVRAIRTY